MDEATSLTLPVDPIFTCASAAAAAAAAASSAESAAAEGASCTGSVSLMMGLGVGLASRDWRHALVVDVGVVAQRRGLCLAQDGGRGGNRLCKRVRGRVSLQRRGKSGHQGEGYVRKDSEELVFRPLRPWPLGL